MSYYRVCQCCGSHLDPGEACDCGKKETVVSAANTNNGNGGKWFGAPFSTSNHNRIIWRAQV